MLYFAINSIINIMNNLKIAIGSDHGGFQLKEKIINYLKSKNLIYKDFGTFNENSCDYPQIAKEVAAEVASNNYTRGILICGSGIGMSIAANRYDKVRAALCWDITTASLSRLHNDSNILCLGQRVLNESLALEMVDVWLNTEFEGGRHQARVQMLRENK